MPAKSYIVPSVSPAQEGFVERKRLVAGLVGFASVIAALWITAGAGWPVCCIPLPYPLP